MVNRCFEFVLVKWVKQVWLLRTKGGEGKIGGDSGGGLGRMTSSSSIVGWPFVINTYSWPRLDRSKLVASITSSIKGSLGSSRVRFFRNDEIGFGGSGSTANILKSGGFEEAPMVGSGGWYNGSLSFFLGGGSFYDLVWNSGLSRDGYIMAEKIPLVLKGLWSGCVMASRWRFCPREVKGMDISLYNDCRGWKGV